jgi:hypothetical protein
MALAGPAALVLAVAAGCAVSQQWTTATRLQTWARAQGGLGASTWQELWVVERSGASGSEVRSSWKVRDPSTGQIAELPLTRTDLRAEVVGRFSTVAVRQRFENPFRTEVEGEYSFPLPGNAAVSDFVVTIGARNIRGVVREREEARRIYDAARAQGLLASLLREDSPGRFSQRVANLAPESAIDVRLEYFQALACRDGWCELVLPLARRDAVHPVSLEVAVDACVPIEDAESSLATAELERPSPARLALRRADVEPGPETEFRLRFRVGGRSPSAALLGSDDGEGGTFCLLVYPAAAPASRGELEIDWGGLDVHDVYSDPRGAPDEARVVLGRYRGRGGSIRLRRPGEAPLHVELQPRVFPARSLSRTWARARIDDLCRRATASDDPAFASRCRDDIRALALEHGLSSFLTAFVVVDARS